MKITYHCHSYEALSKEELYRIMVLRQEVFVVEQHCSYLDADGKDQAAFHLMGLTSGGRLATYARLLPKGVGYENYAAIGRVITADFARGKGLGKALMQTAIEELYRCFGQQSIKLSAQAHLQGYYSSVGFEAQPPVYLEDGIPHIAMIKKQTLNTII